MIDKTVNFVNTHLLNNAGNISVVGEPGKNQIIGSQYQLIDKNAKVAGVMSGGSTPTGGLGAAARGMGTVVGVRASVLNTDTAGGVAYGGCTSSKQMLCIR